MAFRSWIEHQPWQGNELDKDIIVPGNKVYGPGTCVFVSREVNQILTHKRRNNGGLPPGVSWHEERRKFRAQCTSKGKVHSLGRYSTVTDAYTAYLVFKTEIVRQHANDYTQQLGVIVGMQRHLILLEAELEALCLL